MTVFTVESLDVPPEVKRKLAECGIDTIGKLIRYPRHNLSDYGITRFEVELIERALGASDLELNMSNRGRR